MQPVMLCFQGRWVYMSLLLIEQALQLTDTLRRQVEEGDWSGAADTEQKLVGCFNQVQSDAAESERMDFEKLKRWLQSNQDLLAVVESKKEEAQKALLHLRKGKKGVKAYKNTNF
jgi:hypothetical protein